MVKKNRLELEKEKITWRDGIKALGLVMAGVVGVFIPWILGWIVVFSWMRGGM